MKLLKSWLGLRSGGAPVNRTFVLKHGAGAAVRVGRDGVGGPL